MNYDALIASIANAHQHAQAGAAGAVNRQLILRNWLIGAFIKDFEQNGEDRVAYGTQLLDHLQSFLLEFGIGFCFEARQKRFTVGDEHDHLDLVFYHRILRCHLLIDLKTRAFRHGDAGQMSFHLNYWKAEMMQPGDEPPVGLILCTDKKETRVDYATAGLDQQIFVSRYLVALPKPEELERLIETDRAAWEQHHGADAEPQAD